MICYKAVLICMKMTGQTNEREEQIIIYKPRSTNFWYMLIQSGLNE